MLNCNQLHQKTPFTMAPSVNFSTDEKTATPIPEEFRALDRYWGASNYLSVGQIYLYGKNPLLRRPLALSDIKPRLLGHWGTVPGQNFIYCHLNRLIMKRGVSVLYISGPGHGGNAQVAQSYLEGTYSEIYPNITEDEEGIGKLFKQFSFPGGIPSHCSPDTPGSMHEGGELGYSLSHAFGAVLDKPNLIVACVVGDGEAETGPLATSWHSNKFLNPKTDGVVLPILHLNGYKIANPTLLDRIPKAELISLFVGYGYEPILVEGSDPGKMHPQFAAALDRCYDRIAQIKADANACKGKMARPVWPMLILRTPKGWTGPKVVDGNLIEGTHRSHQVPMSSPTENASHLPILEAWLKSYKPTELFDSNGTLIPELKALVVPHELRMSANPYTNPCTKKLILPDFTPFGVTFSNRGELKASDCEVFGEYLRAIVEANEPTKNFRIFGPDETQSNRLGAVFKVTKKQFMGEIDEERDENMAQYGRVMEMLSEHTCEGWLEGYILTGGHGLLNSYEAFIHIISSMFNQHAKWIKMIKEIHWRNRLAGLNILLASHVWRQDHNGFTHQDPGFLNHVITKKAANVRIYLPPDANCLLYVMHRCFASYNRINVVVAGKHPAPQWLSIDEAKVHCKLGLSVWEWASNDRGTGPDVVIACAGDVPTLEALAATQLLRTRLPKLKVRFVNVVDLMKLLKPEEHEHGLTDENFDSLFTKDKPVVFAFHGYPHLIQKLVFARSNQNFTVKGYIEEGALLVERNIHRTSKKETHYSLADASLAFTVFSYCRHHYNSV
jgi:xylulose-5-phosphate/fructose-6-phosphate phosphoketolase